MKIDLFSCGGGFLSGASSLGIDFDVAVDLDPTLTSSAYRNFPRTKHILRDLSLAGRDDADDWTKGKEVDLVVGGPPCQGFSLMGRRDPTDPRRNLLDHFFRITSLLKPRVFVMENVAGLASKETMPLLEGSLERWMRDYSILEAKVLDASEFGVPTRRRRVFVVGYDPRRCDPLDWSGLLPAVDKPDVRDAIGDLIGARRQPSVRECRPLWRLDGRRKVSPYASALRRRDGLVDGMEPTEHTPPVVERFASVPQGAMDRIGRYPRLAWGGVCPTLRAGTGSDRGSHQAIRPIHPDENRVITVREAARLQGFPDWHEFHPTKWHSFRMIGNSVAPPMAAALFDWIDRVVDLGRTDELIAAE